MTDAGRTLIDRLMNDGDYIVDDEGKERWVQNSPEVDELEPAIAAIENEAAQRAVDELLDVVERLAAALHSTFEDFCLDPELGHDMPDDWWTKKAAALIAELRKP